MKKKILGIAMIAMSLVAFSGVAQNNKIENSNEKGKVENVKGKKGDKKGDRNFDKKDKKEKCGFDKKEKKGDRNYAKGERKDKNPFANMNLTDAQQQKLQQLNESRRVAREQKKMALKEEKQRNDSIKKVERLADKKSYLEEVKAIIGPDQYVVFLENYYINGGHNKGIKAMKPGQKGGKKDMAHNSQKKENRVNKDQKVRS